MPDACLPALHIRPPQGWLNDPNGLCRIDDVYHVFFQHNPDAAVHGSIHWGHARSTDLLRWDYEPPALVPRPGAIDGAGCWSGCVVDDDGVPTAVYTAVPDNAQNAGVALARSDRTLRVWQTETGFVQPTPEDPAIDEVRDPFVFHHLGRRFAVQGAGQRHGRPQLLLFGCDDLSSWVPLGALLDADDPVAAEVADANLWECPNLARIDDRWVLVVSLWRWRDETHELAGVRYLVGDLVPAGDGLRFVAGSGGILDTGAAFYAPQLLAEPGRTLLWGWAWEVGRTEEQVRTAGWAGVLTFPRELFLRQGELAARPAAELVGLRRAQLDWSAGFAAPAFEVVASGPVRLSLLDGAEPVLVAAAATASAAEPARILVDGSLVETFVAGVTRTDRVYPGPGAVWLVDGDPPAVRVFRLGG